MGDTSLVLNCTAIKLLSQCKGDVVLYGKCETIDIKNQSQGDFSSSDLVAQELPIKNMGEGDIELFAEKSITINHYGSGYIHYSGNAVSKDMKQHGDGQIKHINKENNNT